MSPITNATVIDAKRSVVLELSAGDIKNSSVKDPANCAFAQACKRILKVDEALIFRTRAYLRTGSQWKRYVVPESVYREVTAYDRGGAMAPGTYRLLAVSPSSQLGLGHSQGRSAKPKRSRAPKVVHHSTKDIRIEMDHGLSIYERLGA